MTQEQVFNTKNPSTLAELAKKSNDFFVISALAMNKSTPPECYDVVIDKLIEEDPEGMYLSQFAKRRNASEKTLRKLANLHIFKVDLELAKNRNTPEQILGEISERTDSIAILGELTCNLSSPLWLRQLGVRTPEIKEYTSKKNAEFWKDFEG